MVPGLSKMVEQRYAVKVRPSDPESSKSIPEGVIAAQV